MAECKCQTLSFVSASWLQMGDSQLKGCQYFFPGPSSGYAAQVRLGLMPAVRTMSIPFADRVMSLPLLLSALLRPEQPLRSLEIDHSHLMWQGLLAAPAWQGCTSSFSTTTQSPATA